MSIWVRIFGVALERLPLANPQDQDPQAGVPPCLRTQFLKTFENVSLQDRTTTWSAEPEAIRAQKRAIDNDPIWLQGQLTKLSYGFEGTKVPLTN